MSHQGKHPGGRPALLRDALHAIIRSGPPEGLLVAEIAALAGHRIRCTKQSLHKCKAAGRLWTVPHGKQTRYFTTAAARDAAAPHIAAVRDAAKAKLLAAKREGQRQYYARKCLERGVPVTPRDKVLARKPVGKEFLGAIVKPAKSRPRKPGFVRAPDGPVITPDHVRVQYCQGYTGDRWGVTLPADGLVAEWRQLRGQPSATA